MEIIPYDFIESIQKQVDEMTTEDSQNKMKEVYLNQPNLSEYIVAMNQDLDDEINKFTLYLFSIIYLAIKSFYQKDLEVISDEIIIKAHENNIELLESLEISHELFVNQTAETNLKNQPGIYKFITESIFEELNEIIDISEDEEGWIFLILKSTIDALNEKVN
jgi:hypothetical protein